MSCKVGIIGLGTMGSMAAWQLASRGVSVIGFEQFGIGHDRSAAGGESRLFRTVYKEGAQYVPLLKEARTLWRRLETETNRDLLTLTGGLTIGHPEAEVIRNVLDCVNQFSIDHVILDSKEAAKMFPQHVLLKDEMMVLDKEAGYIRPEMSVVSAVTRAEELGAEIHRYTTVEAIEATGEGVTIFAKGKKYKFDRLLIATGPWVKQLLPSFHSFISVKKVILTWFPANDIKQFLPERFPVFTRTSEGIRFFGAPTLDQYMVKVGVSHGIKEVADANQLNRTVELDELADTLEIVKKYFTGLIPEPVRASAYMDSYTPDDHSVVGKIPDMPNSFVIGGFSGHGFKLAPIIGKLAADLVLEEKIHYDIEHLSPKRYVMKV
jgi:sarcosine oxidase